MAFAAVVWQLRRVDVHLLGWVLLHCAPYERGESADMAAAAVVVIDPLARARVCVRVCFFSSLA